MKNYDYRLVVTNGLNVGKVLTRSNSIDRILKEWEHDNYDRKGNKYVDHNSEIEILWHDGKYRGVYEGGIE